ncbi:hypothetical protein JSY14_08835 [Brachybacterium sp. EF45031]|nr:hypothetical protein [Brachybacterium sillae]MCS6712120.1 hypothetical protein [Brachybacterium sillae]
MTFLGADPDAETVPCGESHAVLLASVEPSTRERRGWVQIEVRRLEQTDA